MRCVGHVARIGKIHVHIGFWWGNLCEGDHLEDQGINGSIILRWIFRKSVVVECTGLIWIGTDGGHL
jgi:hypothetical protein